MKKVTMQDVADAVGVSRISIWKAINGRPGVSDALRKQILNKATDMGYLTQAKPELPHMKERTVSVVVSRPESSSFWMQIIHHMAKELARSNINLMYTYMPSYYKAGYTLPSALSPEATEGFVVLNIYDEKLLEMLAASPLPKVFLDTVPTVPFSKLSGDLVLLEGRMHIREITKRLLASGRKNLGFIGDVNYAQTNHDRYLGFLDAHEEMGIVPDPHSSSIKPIDLRSHYEDISDFLEELDTMPDAFVCASDFIAHYAQRYLTESKCEVPKNFLLTGFDNNMEYPNVAERITTVDVETSSLGKRLARKIVFRADYPAASYEASYVASRIIFRDNL
ncbi:MAG: LacI family transcriptional regulator [Clostridiales bacterium]|nr:LacI family transcriptional regulator [Clostridiales bacterium]